DTVILKLKEKLKSFSGDVKERKVEREVQEIETLNLELDHKVDVAPLAPKLHKNRTGHSDYIRHTQEEAATFREIVESERLLSPLNTSLDYALTPKNKTKQIRCTAQITKSERTTVATSPSANTDSNTHVLSSTGVTLVSSASVSMSQDNTKKNKIQQTQKKAKKTELEDHLRTVKSSLNKASVVDSKATSSHMPGDRSQLINFVQKFLGTVKFGTDHVAKIMDYGDYQIGNVTISRSSSGPALQEMTPGTISLGLVQKSSSSTSYVPPLRNDWDLLFQPMFDELLNPPPSVDNQAAEVIAPIAEVIPQVDDDSTGSPSSTTIDQDAPLPSKSPTPTEIQPSVILQDVRNDNLDIEVAHIGNDSLLGVPIPEVTSKQSSSTASPQSNVQHNHPMPHHNSKWTKDHPLNYIIGPLSRPVSTRLQLHEQAFFCYYDAFLTSVEPKTYKEALTQACRIEAMQEELHEFERLEVYELVPRPDKVMMITLKWIYKVKLDELEGILKNKARLVARGYRQEEGIDFE
nr:hypothetical protein [Tanacetum cinerariifolium]